MVKLRKKKKNKFLSNIFLKFLGKGFQTWEYDPQYGLRSYFYILLHTGVASYTLKTF